jgi:hypothetical protein
MMTAPTHPFIAFKTAKVDKRFDGPLSYLLFGTGDIFVFPEKRFALAFLAQVLFVVRPSIPLGGK